MVRRPPIAHRRSLTMDPQARFCPNPQCPARGQTAQGNIKVHSYPQRRYRCHDLPQDLRRHHRHTLLPPAHRPGGVRLRRHLAGLWLPDPGRRRRLRPGRTHGGGLAGQGRAPCSGRPSPLPQRLRGRPAACAGRRDLRRDRRRTSRAGHGHGRAVSALAGRGGQPGAGSRPHRTLGRSGSPGPDAGPDPADLRRWAGQLRHGLLEGLP